MRDIVSLWTKDSSQKAYKVSLQDSWFEMLRPAMWSEGGRRCDPNADAKGRALGSGLGLRSFPWSFGAGPRIGVLASLSRLLWCLLHSLRSFCGDCVILSTRSMTFDSFPRLVLGYLLYIFQSVCDCFMLSTRWCDICFILSTPATFATFSQLVLWCVLFRWGTCCNGIRIDRHRVMLYMPYMMVPHHII